MSIGIKFVSLGKEDVIFDQVALILPNIHVVKLGSVVGRFSIRYFILLYRDLLPSSFYISRQLLLHHQQARQYLGKFQVMTTQRPALKIEMLWIDPSRLVSLLRMQCSYQANGIRRYLTFFWYSG
jgi:hypothetical protein